MRAFRPIESVTRERAEAYQAFTQTDDTPAAPRMSFRQVAKKVAE